jgi:hypothetical protein
MTVLHIIGYFSSEYVSGIKSWIIILLLQNIATLMINVAMDSQNSIQQYFLVKRCNKGLINLTPIPHPQKCFCQSRVWVLLAIPCTQYRHTWKIFEIKILQRFSIRTTLFEIRFCNGFPLGPPCLKSDSAMVFPLELPCLKSRLCNSFPLGQPCLKSDYAMVFH